MSFSKIAYYIIIFLALSCQPQDYGKLVRISAMPSILHENSGIAFIKNSDLLYAINDSGNSSTVFGLDIKSGKISKEIKLNNTGNDNWEDLTADNNFLYVGDFGNNKNKRENLNIYWIPNDIILGKSGKDDEL